MRGQQQRCRRYAFGKQFFRRVPHRPARCPDQFVQPLLQLRALLVLHQALVLLAVFLFGLLQIVAQLLARRVQLTRFRLPPEKMLDRHAQLVVPVAVETLAELLGDRTGAKQINVGEVHRLVGLEVLVAEVASADDGQAAIDQHQLVVHAPMLQRKVQ